MSARLCFPDPHAAADVLTFAGRAARTGDGAIHLRAAGGILITRAAPLVRQGLLDATPTILGLRTVPVDPELECDLVVEACTLVAARDEREILLPQTALEPPLWSETDVPRAGWKTGATLAAGMLAARAQWGMSAVAHALPDDPGDPVVQAVRGQVWNAPDEDLGDLPRGVAFAASVLGFLADESEAAVVRTHGRWIRISLSRGHVLLRGPLHTGLTPVRTTGEHVA